MKTPWHEYGAVACPRSSSPAQSSYFKALTSKTCSVDHFYEPSRLGGGGRGHEAQINEIVRLLHTCITLYCAKDGELQEVASGSQ